MTCIKTITGNGAVLPPMFIFLTAQHMKYWFNGSLAKKVVFAVLEPGYTNDEITLEWLYQFEQYSWQRQVGAWQLLVLNRYGLHCIIEFISYFNHHKIVPLCFSPHESHLIKLLDVVVIESYKHY